MTSVGRDYLACATARKLHRCEQRKAIRRAGLEPAVTEREDSDAEPGTVLEQDPTAGTRLAKGRTVELVVAKAPAEVKVPGVIDASETDAVAALEDAGFEVRVEDGTAETPAEDGIVLDQDPAPDSSLPKGSRVTITVGRFEPEVVPEDTPTPEAVP